MPENQELKDHYAWKGPFEAYQKFLQEKLKREGNFTKGDVNSWNNIISILQRNDQGFYAEYAKKIRDLCIQIDKYRGKGPQKEQDLQQKNGIKYQNQLDAFVESQLTINRINPNNLINKLKQDNTDILFDERFDRIKNGWQLVMFDSAKEMGKFKDKVKEQMETCLKFIYDRGGAAKFVDFK